MASDSTICVVFSVPDTSVNLGIEVFDVNISITGSIRALFSMYTNIAYDDTNVKERLTALENGGAAYASIKRYLIDGGYHYLGNADKGTSESAETWVIYRLTFGDTTSTATAVGAWTNVLNLIYT